MHDDVANRAFLDAFDRFHISRLMAALSAGGNLQPFLLRQLARGIHDAATGTIGRHWLFREDVFARFDCRP